MRWLIPFLVFACSTERHEKEKEVEWVQAQPIPRQECPVCPACPGDGPIIVPVPPIPTPYPGENRIVTAINAARIARGLPTVSEDTYLNCAAIAHAKDIQPRNICGHVGSDGSQFWQRARKCGAEALGEIVACGYPDEKSAVRGWDTSPGHAAIMYGDYSKVGVGEVNGFYVAVFGK